MNVDGLRKLCLAFPGATEQIQWGYDLLFKVGGKMFACIASHKSAEPNTLVVKMDFANRDAFIEEDPAAYYLKEHYIGYPCVLVRLSRVHPDALRDLIIGAHRYVSARASKKSASPPRRARTRVHVGTSPRARSIGRPSTA